MTEPDAPRTGWEEPVIRCARAGCGHDHEQHRPAWVTEAPGRCMGAGWSCACRGFLWVDPAGTAGSYSSPPSN